MKATLKGKKLIFELLIEKPKPSHFGKTTLLATTHGVRPTNLKVDGKTICLTANAFCYPDDGESTRAEIIARKGKAADHVRGTKS